MFRLFSIIALLLNLATIALVVYFRPVYHEERDINVATYKYVGKFSTGFVPTDSKFEKADALLTVFSPKEPNDEVSYKTDAGDTVRASFDAGKPVVIFIGDKRASTQMYRPYLEKIAADGYTVISGEFFASDMKWIEGAPDTPLFRRFVMNVEDLGGTLDLDSQKTNFTAKIVKEYTMLLYLALDFNEGRKPFFLIGDESSSDALPLVAAMYSDAVAGFFDMSSLEPYPAGYGFLEQTDPFLAYLHGRERDGERKLPLMLAARSEESIILHSALSIKSDDSDDNVEENIEENGEEI